MSENWKFRLFFGLVLVTAVLFLHFWVVFFLALLGVILFPKYYEMPFLLLLSDLFYGAVEEKFFGMVGIQFLIALVLVVAVDYLKKELKFYTK